MKMNHFALIFALIMITVVVYTDIRTNNLKMVIETKEQINRNLDSAIGDGISNLIEVDESNNILIDKEGATISFFLSLYSSFDILSDTYSQGKLNLYIPVVTIVEEDGYDIFYSDEYVGSDGHKYVAKRWSEKYPYFYEDADFIYRFSLGDIVTIYDKNNLLGGGIEQTTYQMDYHDFQTESNFAAFRTVRPDSLLLNDTSYELVRKEAIINCLESSMSYYTSRHNKIASNYGITYNFSLPMMSENVWASCIDETSMFVVFQGYPYGNQIGETYNRVASAGAKISKNNVYYIEQKGWHLVYHKDNCSELLKEAVILRDEPYYDFNDCIDQGCYQCPVCTPNGTYAPDYNNP